MSARDNVFRACRGLTIRLVSYAHQGEVYGCNRCGDYSNAEQEKAKAPVCRQRIGLSSISKDIELLLDFGLES